MKRAWPLAFIAVLASTGCSSTSLAKRHASPVAVTPPPNTVETRAAQLQSKGASEGAAKQQALTEYALSGRRDEISAEHYRMSAVPRDTSQAKLERGLEAMDRANRR